MIIQFIGKVAETEKEVCILTATYKQLDIGIQTAQKEVCILTAYPTRP